MSETGELRAALHAGAACLRKYRPGETGKRQAELLELNARALEEIEEVDLGEMRLMGYDDLKKEGLIP